LYNGSHVPRGVRVRLLLLLSNRQLPAQESVYTLIDQQSKDFKGPEATWFPAFLFCAERAGDGAAALFSNSRAAGSSSWATRP
jgi:hypothetical protein